MADSTSTRELTREPIVGDDNLLEQLVASVQRIETGIEAAYAGVVMLDEHLRVRATPLPQLDRTRALAAFVEGWLSVEIERAAPSTKEEIVRSLRALRTQLLEEYIK